MSEVGILLGLIPYSPPKQSFSCAGKRYSPKMIERYKSYSIDGQIWSTLVASNDGTSPANTSKNLKALADDGFLTAVGKYKQSKASNKPILYKWN